VEKRQMEDVRHKSPRAGRRAWITRTVVAITLATFFSDLSHELCTAVLPLYLASVGLGPAALGIIEGVADFLVSLSKLAGGVVGHHVKRKRPWASAGYLVTALGTWGLAFTSSLAAMVALRSAAWIGRGFRAPLRDYLLADAVTKEHFGRVYGLERAGDMLGAVAGPLMAWLLLWAGLEFRTIILWTLAPGLAAAGAFFILTQEQIVLTKPQSTSGKLPAARSAAFPREFWWVLAGVFLFGLGDFSRTFIVWLAANAAGESQNPTGGGLSLAVMLYLLHNLVSAATAYPVGHMADRRAKLPVLIGGYAVGVATNLLLAFQAGALGWLILAIVLSGAYIAIEETLEKAVIAELLPKERRSLGFGILASGNAVGDMVSSLYVGCLLEAGLPQLAFGIAASLGAAGVGWMLWLVWRRH
jgi:MFS family permease